MSRIAKYPVAVPSGVEITIADEAINIKGSNGQLDFGLNGDVKVNHEDGQLSFEPANDSKQAKAMSGTVRSIVNNMVEGVSNGFQKKLTIIGVGYRAQAQGDKLNLTLGFSHPVVFNIPEGISIETPTQTEVVIKGADKQKVGQVAAEIRRYRPPEPYKGKGVRYSDERVIRKQAKKK